VAEMDCNHYSDPLMELKFPLTFNTTYQDSYKSSWWDFILLEYVKWVGVYKSSANAYGTLILPDNSIYNNTLQLKTIKNFRKISSKGERSYSYVSYIWYSETHRGPLLVLSRNNAGELVEAYLYKNYLYTGVENQNRNNNFDIQLYPNPVFSTSRIEFPNKNDEYSISVYNTIGELVKNEKVYSGNYIINRNDLPSGVYFLLIRNKNEFIGAQKFLIVK
jgi:hypothetical protein